MLNPPVITFVVPCMGRLEHLKHTLPLLAQQPCSEVIVVDYSDPDHCAEWIEHPSQSWSNVRAVRYPGQPFFNLSRARNIGASHCQTKYIAFIDADVILKGDKELNIWFTDLIAPALDERYYICFNKWQCGHSGFLLCWYPAFIYAGGYPAKTPGWGYSGEDMEGYGFDDGYMRMALRKIGVQERKVTTDLAEHIQHSQVTRVSHYAQKDSSIEITQPRNSELAKNYLAKWNPYPLFGCNNQG